MSMNVPYIVIDECNRLSKDVFLNFRVFLSGTEETREAARS